MSANHESQQSYLTLIRLVRASEPSLDVESVYESLLGSNQHNGPARYQVDFQLDELDRHGLVDRVHGHVVSFPHAELIDAAAYEGRRYVYFIRIGEDGPIKIGLTDDVKRRLEQLQTAHPDALRVIACVPGDRRLEAHLHQRFSAERISGEWFHPSSSLISLAGMLGMFGSQ